MSNRLLLDIGSTFIKYCICDDLNKIVFEDKLPFPAPCFNKGNRFLVDSETIFETVKNIFNTGVAYKCGFAYISVQMHGYITMDENGRFSNYVSWRDKSGDITKPFLAGLDYDKLGTSLKDNLPLAKIDINSFNGTFFTLGSFIIYRLLGKNITHITDACASGFFNAESGRCEMGIEAKFPTVSTSVEKVGTYKGISVFAPFGDHQISFLGSNAKTDSYLINIGTATQISCLAKMDEISGDYEKRPYFFAENRLFTISGLVGGELLYKNQGKELFVKQILDAVKILPQKKKAVFGGGGSKLVEKDLIDKLERIGISCEFCEENLGRKGLIEISKDNIIKKGVMHSEIPFANFPIIAKNCGLDFVILDNEHGAFDFSAIKEIVTTANLYDVNLIIRIGNSNREYVTKLADLGAHGFLLPMTNTAKDIANVVEFAKYAPLGKRGISTTRAHTLYNPPPLKEYMRSANEKMKIYAQIETKTGMDNLEEILAVNGVDGVFIGPNDLSIDLDCVGDNEILCKAISFIGKTCVRNNKPFGIITGSNKLINCAKENGATMFSIGSELNMLINGCKAVKETF